jgi:uncharacterized protein involved in exopolysaccharide biosynthesis
MPKQKKYKNTCDFDSTDLLLYIWQNRKPLIVIAVSAFIFSLTVSLLITPKYKASVVMFSATGAPVSKSLISENYSGSQSLFEAGSEEHTEQLLQVLNSDEIRDRIILKHDLFRHYGVDPDAGYPRTKIYSRYKSNIKFRRTPLMSVVIEVLDKDPRKAADIANDIASLVDTVFHRIFQQRTAEAFKLVEAEYQSITESLKILQDSITVIRRLGVNHYETQSERYYEAYAKAISENNIRAAETLAGKIKILSEYGTQYVALRDQLVHETARLARIKQKYAESKMEMEQTLPCKFIVNNAAIPEKKAYPRKSLIILISVFASCLMGLITLLVLEKIKPKIPDQI